MKTSLVKGLDEQAKMEITQEFIASAQFRKHFTSLLQDRVASHRIKSISADSYDNPNWALKQADLVGYARAIDEVISLLSSEKV